MVDCSTRNLHFIRSLALGKAHAICFDDVVRPSLSLASCSPSSLYRSFYDGLGALLRTSSFLTRSLEEIPRRQLEYVISTAWIRL